MTFVGFSSTAPSVQNPEWHEPTARYRYRVCGRDYDGEPLTVVVTIEPDMGLISIITGTDC